MSRTSARILDIQMFGGPPTLIATVKDNIDYIGVCCFPILPLLQCVGSS